MNNTVVFGEAERGKLLTLMQIKNLERLAFELGNPPEGSLAIHYAIQVLMFEYQLIFVRIREEGFSKRDYYQGFKLLQEANNITRLSAICIPGVGDPEIIDQAALLCQRFQALLITTEKDFYDYFTSVA